MTHSAEPIGVQPAIDLRAPGRVARDRVPGMGGVEPAAGLPSIDYDVHGLIGVRLIDPAPADTRTVERHLRGFAAPLSREPDLVVRFVDRLPVDGFRCVDVDRSGFTDEGFFVRCRGARTGWVRVPFERLGAPCELVSERGLGHVPYLRPVLRLAALRRGYLPLHASAFEWNGVGVLVTGWTHGGKTSSLLAFAEQGARFVGDDLVFLSADGRRMFGMSTPLNVSTAQLGQSERLRDHVSRRRLLALRGLDSLDRTEEQLTRRWPRGAYPLALLRRAMRPVRRRVNVHMSPELAFWNGVRPTAEPRKLFLMMSHRQAGVSVEPTDPMDVAERMIHSLRYEDLGLLAEYSAFRFAFPQPQQANDLIERAHEIAHARLRQAFAGMDAYVVRHPYPPPLRTLYDVMRPLCEGDPPRRAGT